MRNWETKKSVYLPNDIVGPQQIVDTWDMLKSGFELRDNTNSVAYEGLHSTVILCN